MAEKLLQKKGVANLEKILIDRDPAQRELMMTRTGPVSYTHLTLPTILRV